MTSIAEEKGQKQRWHCLRCAVPATQAEGVAVRCFELGSCGLQTEDDGDEVRLRAYFDETQDRAAIRQGVEERLRVSGLDTEVAIDWVEEEDWEAGWRVFFRPIRATSRIVVHPSWISIPAEADQIAIVIDPQMAFGTGGHESTRLCLRGLEECLRPGDRCLDLGTGSGVLAIAAARLGAGRVLAVDVDPQAVANARENLVRNRLREGRIEVCQGSLEQVGEESFEVVLANIQSGILRPLLGPVSRVLAAGGLALFSGLLEREAQEFGAWVAAAGLRVEKVLVENGWICLLARRVG